MAAMDEQTLPAALPDAPGADDVIHVGDALDVLERMDAESVHAVVTDPPYGLSKSPDMAEVLRHWLAGDDYEHRGGGFMGQRWDSFVPGPSVWREALRVLKPGGYLLAFGGTRTADLLSIAVRLAGFEVRDTIMWVYGSGFPKSRDISKALDKAAGEERPVVGTKLGKPGYSLAEGPPNAIYGQGIGGSGDPEREAEITAPVTPDAQRWAGWGTALKPAYEPIIVARKPFRSTVERNVLEYGTGALNIDASRVAVPGGSPAKKRRESTTPSSVRTDREGRDRAVINRSSDEAFLRERPGEDEGRWPPNLVLTHTPGCDEDGCVPGCPVEALDDQAGELRSGSESAGGHVRNSDKFRSTYQAFEGQRREEGRLYGDTGGASRFFPTFRYVAKPSDLERNAGCGDLDTAAVFREEYATLNNPTCGACGRRRVGELDDPSCECDEPEWSANNDREKANFHPTVKPIDLMRWLVRLVTPPGGVVLDPYAGSGTTLCAAAVEGLIPVGIENHEPYLPIVEARLAFWRAVPVGTSTEEALGVERRRREHERARREREDAGQLGLLG